MRSIDEIVVIGAGNWGLAFASVLSRTIRSRVWTSNATNAAHLRSNRHRPGANFPFSIPDEIRIEEKYSVQVADQRALFVMAVPSSQMAAASRELGRHYGHPLVLCVSKGFELARQCTMSEVIRREIPGAIVAVLTGPTIANEVAVGKPTRAVLACDDLVCLALVKGALKNDVISFEIGRNPTHHEICAALKGLVAIGVGMAQGLELGSNAQGVIMTQGFREMVEVASFFGIPESVAYGISGAGDLITTCISPESRNRRLGTLLAKGLTLVEALEQVRMTVEGVAMSQTIETLWSLDVSIPLIHMVNAVLRGQARDLRSELAQLIANL